EPEGDDRLAGALVEAWLGIGQILAGDHHALLDQVGSTVSILEELGVRRRSVLNRLLGAYREIDQAKCELRGFADDLLEVRRILQPGHLDENAIDALALDARLDGAELVDTALHDRDGLVDRLPDALGDRRLAQCEPD